MKIDNQTIEVYNQKKEEYLKLIEKPPSQSLLDFISLVKRNGWVLDLGCGPGMASALMQKHRLRTDPVDASMEMVKIAKQIYGLKARQGEFSEIHGEDIYDGVWANFSLLHATKSEFKLYMQLIYKVLKPLGYFSIGMKLGKGERRDEIGRFYAYYTEKELTQILMDVGLNPCKTYHGKEMGLVGEVEPWIMLRSRK